MYRYVGPEGEYLPGVPTRDLTDKEAKAYGVDDLDPPLYRKLTEPEAEETEPETTEEGSTE